MKRLVLAAVCLFCFNQAQAVCGTFDAINRTLITQDQSLEVVTKTDALEQELEELQGKKVCVEGDVDESSVEVTRIKGCYNGQSFDESCDTSTDKDIILEM